jgi:arsenate reductase-like glutaredoxin family protein
MVSVLSRVINKFTSDDEIKIEEMSLDELKEERSELRADLELKRDKHEGLAEKRRTKFEKLRDTEDDLLKEELAEEIASIEDEMSIYHNEHAQVMDALRVIDGLIAVKRKQQLMEDQGIVQELEDMDQEELVDTLKQQEVQEMIKEEKWEDLRDLFRGQLEANHSGNKRVNEIIESAEENKDESVDVALQKRDRQRDHNIH